MTREEAIKLIMAIEMRYMTLGNDEINALDMAIEALEKQPCDDVVSRECNNCAYYVNGANAVACDGCFTYKNEYPNFKPKENLHKILFVKFINKVSIEACIHGADTGGSYSQNKDGLVKALEDIKTYYGLVEYDIGEIYNDDGWSSYGFIKRNG